MVAVSDYDPQRRTRREHKRVIRQGSERFEADRFLLDGQSDPEAAIREQDADAGIDADDDEAGAIVKDDGVDDAGVDDALVNPEHAQTTRERDDERRILGELPPHWAQFNERD